MTTKASFTIELASVVDRDDLVAELWFGQELFAELRYESGSAILQVYGAPAGGHWELPNEELQAALQQARDKLGPPLPEYSGHPITDSVPAPARGERPRRESASLLPLLSTSTMLIFGAQDEADKFGYGGIVKRRR